LSGLKESTIKRYKSMIRKFVLATNKDPESISLDDVRDFLLDLKENKKLSIGTVNDYRSAIKYFFLVVLDKGWNDKKIAYLKGYKTLPVVLEKTEILNILDSIDDILCKTIFTTMYSGGLRINEVLNLKISDIDSKRMQICIRESKSGRERRAILSEKNLELLRELLKNHPVASPKKWDSEDYIFCLSSRDKHICSKSVRLNLIQTLQKLNIRKNTSTHVFRHSFATHLLEDGVSIFTIKELLGHKSISSTCVYLHVIDARKIGGKSPLDISDGGV